MNTSLVLWKHKKVPTKATWVPREHRTLGIGSKKLQNLESVECRTLSQWHWKYGTPETLNCGNIVLTIVLAATANVSPMWGYCAWWLLYELVSMTKTEENGFLFLKQHIHYATLQSPCVLSMKTLPGLCYCLHASLFLLETFPGLGLSAFWALLRRKITVER